MNQQEPAQLKKPTHAPYIWAIASMTLGVCLTFLMRYMWTYTLCHREGSCSTLRTVADGVQSLAILMFLGGLLLLTATTIRHLMRRWKQKNHDYEPKLSVRALCAISLSLAIVGFGMLLTIRFWTATTFSTSDDYATMEVTSAIGRPIGATLFLWGVIMLIVATVRYFVLRRKR